MIPQFIMMRQLGLTDTLWSLVLLQAFMHLESFTGNNITVVFQIHYVKVRGLMG